MAVTTRRKEANVELRDFLNTLTRFIGIWSGIILCFFIVLQYTLQLLYVDLMGPPVTLIVITVLSGVIYLIRGYINKIFYPLVGFGIQSVINISGTLALALFSVAQWDGLLLQPLLFLLEIIAVIVWTGLMIMPFLWFSLPANLRAEIDHMFTRSRRR